MNINKSLGNRNGVDIPHLDHALFLQPGLKIP